MHGISNDVLSPDEIIKKAEDKSCHVVIDIRSWHLPVYKQSISYALSTTRDASAIEEFIMKSASLELSYDIEKSMLPELLGLDEVFIEVALNLLEEKGILDKDSLPVLKLSETGKILLEQGKIFDKEQEDEVSYYIDMKTGFVYAKPTADESMPMHPEYAKIDKGIENIKKYINRKFLKSVCDTVGKKLENSDAGTQLSAIVSAKTTDCVKTLFTEVLVYDINENKTFTKIWDHAGMCFRSDLEKITQKLSIALKTISADELQGFINDDGEGLTDEEKKIIILKNIKRKEVF